MHSITLTTGRELVCDLQAVEEELLYVRKAVNFLQIVTDELAGKIPFGEYMPCMMNLIDAKLDAVDARISDLGCGIIGGMHEVPGARSPYMVDETEEDEEQKCRVCGCTQDRGCPGGCYWVEPDLCSVCAADMADAAEAD